MANTLAKKRGCCGPATIASRLRFDPRSAIDLTAEELEFGKSMHAYLKRWETAVATCGMILDVALDLRYVPPMHDFKACVHAFEARLLDYKKSSHRKFPSWSELLMLIGELGWRRPEPEVQAVAVASQASA